MCPLGTVTFVNGPFNKFVCTRFFPETLCQQVSYGNYSKLKSYLWTKRYRKLAPRAPFPVVVSDWVKAERRQTNDRGGEWATGSPRVMRCPPPASQKANMIHLSLHTYRCLADKGGLTPDPQDYLNSNFAVSSPCVFYCGIFSSSWMVRNARPLVSVRLLSSGFFNVCVCGVWF